MKQGFTLSEVLITLGIVGIVAVLTIPGVMKNYKNRLYTAQLEKVYSQYSFWIFINLSNFYFINISKKNRSV